MKMYSKTPVLVLMTLTLMTSGCASLKAAENFENQGSMTTNCIAFNHAVESDNPTIAVADILDTCVENVDKKTFSKYVLRYEELMKEEKANYSKRIFERGNHAELYSVFPDAFDSSKINTVQTPEFRSTLRDLVRSGFTLKKSINGIYEVVIDYSFFKKFHNQINQETGAYFDLMLLEQDHPIIRSGKELVATPEQMKDRLLLMDLYISKYPKSPRLKDMSERANDYLVALIYGFQGVNNPYNDEDIIKEAYYRVYGSFENVEDKRPVVQLLSGLKECLDAHDKKWSEDVYTYIIEFPEIYRKRYLNANIYPEAFVDVGFGWTVEGYLYYYPVFSGISNRAEKGKLNLLGRNIVEKRMLGQGFHGMYTNDNYIWTDYELTFNRRNWISLKYDIYTEYPDESYNWSIESLNYDLEAKRKIHLRDLLAVDEERDIVNKSVKAFFEESRTYYDVSLEDFYKNPNPDFYITGTGIVILVPVSKASESTNRIVEIFIPFEKFNTSVEYIYKIPKHQDGRSK